MPGNLKYYKRDPEYPRRNRGAGQYYIRAGNKGRWSKHSPSLDKKRGGKVGTGNRRHTHDKKAKDIKKKGKKPGPKKKSNTKKKGKKRK